MNKEHELLKIAVGVALIIVMLISIFMVFSPNEIVGRAAGMIIFSMAILVGLLARGR